MRRILLLLTMIRAALLLSSTVAVAAIKIGTNGDDRIRGTDSADQINGKGDNDRLNGKAGMTPTSSRTASGSIR